MIPSQYLEWMKELVANAQEKKYEYLIGRVQNKTNFFYYDFDYIGGADGRLIQLIWTPYQRQAFPFESEQEVEEFKAEHISPRKASIIRVIKPPHSMIELMG
jgi:hypothetical protein